MLERPTIENNPKTKIAFLRIIILCFGVAFLAIALGLAFVLAIAAYNFISQPELFTNLLDYAKTQENLFSKWISNGDIKSIELSNIFTLILIIIAISMVLKVIIGFISICVSSGKSLLNLSRNFDE